MDELKGAQAERDALLGLWAVPGVGPKGLQSLRARLAQGFGNLLEVPTGDWVPDSGLPRNVRERLLGVPTLQRVATRVQERAKSGQMSILFPGDAGFPEGLQTIPSAPPLLFMRGHTGPPHRRLAMVGSRKPEQGFLRLARQLAFEVAREGVLVVSGAAEGVDRACHDGATQAGRPTWAFLGSALDTLDPAQAALEPSVLGSGGAYYSELPPGVRASTTTFPRRNRLIAGASDAVLILRAGEASGSLHTALAALEQDRPLLALPGDIDNATALGCNSLIWTGKARLCRGPADIFATLQMQPGAQVVLDTRAAADWAAALSAEARQAYEALTRAPRSFDEVRGACQLDSAALTSALCELELTGLAVQHPGRRYERI